MDKARNYILDRITSKKTSIEEFNYDTLQAPPLSWFLSPYDIQELRNIATSIKYSGKPEVRYELIDQVCKKRGLIKFGAGTNRVVYRHPEFPDILFKIAADNIGMGDNPAEFRNQFVLKPFVAKTFEISPCGTVALVEKVNPITSREEYISVIDDVFELITEWLIGKYVLADIGSKYIMNVGIRRNFGVVLLDYPYLYEVDGEKLFCNKPDINSPTGFCGGEIDYDDGFNFLVCTKCGKKFRAKELEKEIRDNKLIVEREGDIKMKIVARGGSQNINRNIETESINNDNFLNVKPSIKSSVGDKAIAAMASKKVVFSNDDKKENKPAIKVKKEAPVKKTDGINKSVNGVSTDKIASSPIKISEDIKEEAIKNAPAKKEGIEVVDELGDRIVKILEGSIDTVAEDAVKRLINKLDKFFANTEVENNTEVEADKEEPASKERFEILIDKANGVLRDIEDDAEYEAAAKYKGILDLVNLVYTPNIEINGNRDGNDLVISPYLELYYAWEEIGNNEPAETFNGKHIVLEGIFNQSVNTDPAVHNVVTKDYNTLKAYTGTIISIADILPTTKDYTKIVVFKDEDNDYLAIDGGIVYADHIDDQDISMVTLVPKDYMDKIDKFIEDENLEGELYDEEDDDEDASADSLPLRVEEFLANETDTEEVKVEV